MKRFIQLTLILIGLGLGRHSAEAAFTSLHVFGDSLSTTTTNPSAGPYYYGKRYSNGRVWVEVLAQRQGLTYNSNLNNSFYGNYSTNVLKEVKTFTAPADSNTTLVVVWVDNADLFDLANDATTPVSAWTSAINRSQTNHYQIITNLYAKGIRNLLMPPVVDLSTIPRCNHSSGGYTNTIHQQCIAYNISFAKTLNQARTDCPGLTIYSPDFFALLTNLFAHPADYGVTNALANYGNIVASVDALTALYPSLSLSNGPGTNFIFWDPFNPTAKVHSIVADFAQQFISPARIGKIASLTDSNRLDLVEVPVGLNGFVDGITNLGATNWASVQTITSTTNVQSVFVPVSGPQQFYRLRFPYAWSWP